MWPTTLSGTQLLLQRSLRTEPSVAIRLLTPSIPVAPPLPKGLFASSATQIARTFSPPSKPACYLTFAPLPSKLYLVTQKEARTNHWRGRSTTSETWLGGSLPGEPILRVSLTAVRDRALRWACLYMPVPALFFSQLLYPV